MLIEPRKVQARVLSVLGRVSALMSLLLADFAVESGSVQML